MHACAHPLPLPVPRRLPYYAASSYTPEGRQAGVPWIRLPATSRRPIRNAIVISRDELQETLDISTTHRAVKLKRYKLKHSPTPLALCLLHEDNRHVPFPSHDPNPRSPSNHPPPSTDVPRPMPQPQRANHTEITGKRDVLASRFRLATLLYLPSFFLSLRKTSSHRQSAGAIAEAFPRPNLVIPMPSSGPSQP